MLFSRLCICDICECVKFRPKDESLKDDDAKKAHYCALFKYLITAEGVWAPGHCLDAFMPEVTKKMAKEYLAKNDELSGWFLEEYEEEMKVDAAGLVVNFVTIKEVKTHYETQPIFTSMRKEDQRKFNLKTLKEDFEKNILLKQSFKRAMKVKLASTKRLNTKEGLIHFKRRVERDDDEDAPAAQRPRLVQPQQHHGLDDQFGD